MSRSAARSSRRLVPGLAIIQRAPRCGRILLVKNAAGVFSDSWSSTIEWKILAAFIAINFLSMIARDDGCVKMRLSSINHPFGFNNSEARFGAGSLNYRN
jgi:hypothetical protein